MRRVPRGSSTTRPASLTRRRCRDTAGRLMGSVSAISRTDRPPCPSSSTMARRWGSPRASNGSPVLPAFPVEVIVERWPGWPVAKSAEEFSGDLLAIRELVEDIPAPRCDHRNHEAAALAEQVWVGIRIVPGDRFGRVGEVEFDRPAATGL